MTYCTRHRLLLPSSTCADYVRAESVMVGANKNPVAYGITLAADNGSDVLSKNEEGEKHVRPGLYLHQRAANHLYQHPFHMISKCRDVPTSFPE